MKKFHRNQTPTKHFMEKSSSNAPQTSGLSVIVV